MSSENSGGSAPLHCPQCGQPIRAGDKFCLHCGSALPDTPSPVSPRRQSLHKPAQTTDKKTKGRIWWPYAAVGAVFLIALGIVIHTISTARLASAPLSALAPSGKHHHHAHAVPPSSSQVSPSAAPSLVTPSSASKPSHSTASSSAAPSHAAAIASGGWVGATEVYQGGQLSVTLPKTLSTLQSAAPGSWVWGSSNKALRGDEVSMAVTPEKTSGATEPLGADAYGTPISHTATTASQTLDIGWGSHGWVAFTMVVPLADESWLDTIASSAKVS